MPYLSRVLATTRKPLAMLVSVALVATILVAVDSVLGDADRASAAAARPTLITLTVNRPELLAGQTATLTARTDVSVQGSASTITIVDQTTGAILKTCTTGKACTGTSTFNSGGAHSYVATVNELSSGSVTVSRAPWAISLRAAASTVLAGATTKLTATANQNVGSTGGSYRTLIFDDTTETLLATCETGKTCSVNTTAFYTGDGHSYRAVVATGADGGELVDVQAQSSQVAVSRREWTVALTSNRAQFTAGQTATLTATANQSAASTGGAYEISIFDVTAGVRVKSCATGKTCSIAQSFPSGGPHEYVAAVAAVGSPHELGDVADLQASSNQLSISRAAWSLTAVKVAGTLTAAQDLKFKITANQNLTNTAGSYVIYWFDAVTGQKLGTCATGTNCTVIALKNGTPGGHAYFAVVAAPTNPATFAAAQDIQAVSNTVAAPGYWSVSLTADSAEFVAGSSSTLTATTSHDIDSTGESLAIILFDLTTGLPVGTCEAGTTCTAQVAFASGAPHHYRAVLATSTTPANYGSVIGTQAASTDVVIARAPWTVSLKASTSVFSAGEVVTFTAEANQNVGETSNSYRIYVFDQTSGDRVGQCGIGSACVIDSSELFFTGGSHRFVAVVAESGVLDLSHLTDVQATSEPVALSRAAWSVSLTASATTFAAGQPVTFTATANQDVSLTGAAYQIEILDQTAQTSVATCSDGLVCEAGFEVLFNSGGPHTYVAVVAARDGGPVDVQATSEAVTIARQSWTLVLAATESSNSGDTVTTTLSVETNQHVGATLGQYNVVVLDRTSDEVFIGSACQLTCTFEVSQLASEEPHAYVAFIAHYDTTASPAYSDVQVESNGIVPPIEVSGNWPAINGEVWPGYLRVEGWTATSETPSIILSVTDEESLDPYPEYQFEIRIKDSSAPSNVVASAVELAQRDGNYSYSYLNWDVPPGTFERGEVYWLSVRVIAGTEVGPWSGPTRVYVAEPVATPTAVSPVNNALVGQPVVLTADVGTEEGAEVVFRVETGWDEASGPIEVASGSSVTDADGVAAFEPYLPLGVNREAHLRWQALVQGVGYSEWSDFEEFRVSSVPKAVVIPTAVQYDEAGNRHNRIDVAWYDSNSLQYAPTTGFEVEVNPGHRVVSVNPCGACTTSISGLPAGAYEVSIRALNVLGSGVATTIPVDMASYVPSEPQNVEVHVDRTDARITWQAPEDVSGGAIDHYRLFGMTSTVCGGPFDVTTTDEFLELHDLGEACEYQVNVVAVNAGGESLPVYLIFSAYGLPSAPTDPEVRLGDDGAIDVFWTQAFDNGGPISHYIVTVSPGGQEVTVAAWWNPWGRQGTQISNLTNGTPYSFTIRAVNAAGSGPALETESLAPADKETDSDEDGLVDVAETRVGTNPMLDDTDGDGLTDFDEALNLTGFTDPLLADTDDNGVPDGLEDPDGDTLTNAEEVAAGSSPVSTDSDADGILDQDEAAAGSDPVLADSDEDGLSDPYELSIGSNPALADSDGDTQLDAEENIAATLESDVENVPDDAQVATAEVEGLAADVQAIGIEQASLGDFPGAITPAAVVNAKSAFALNPFAPPTVTSITISYPDYLTSAELGALAPVQWSDERGTWEFVDNDVSVSTADHTITIYSPELGLRYAVVDLAAWRANANQCAAAESGHPALDVELIVDITPSVAATDTTGERFAAMRTVLSSLRSGDRVTIRLFGFMGIVSSGVGGWLEPHSWGIGVKPNVTLNGNWQPAEQMSVSQAIRAVNYLETNSETLVSAGGYGESTIVESAIGGFHPDGYPVPGTTYGGEFANDPFECRIHTLLLVTDGEAQPVLAEEYVDGYVPFLQRMDPVHVLDVGLGDPADSDWLIELAEGTGGTYSYVPTAGDLNAWINKVTPYAHEPEVADNVDSDGDGVKDNDETRGVVATTMRMNVSSQVRFTSNPHDADTDNDGLTDGEELGSVQTAILLGLGTNEGSLGYTVQSDPRQRDGDWDGLTDVEEYEYRFDSLRSDMDHDTILDGPEMDFGTSPTMKDTDHDGFGDLYEVFNTHLGFDPTVADVPIDQYKFIADMGVGFVFGESLFIDSPGWLIGNIASGVVPFSDLRDALVYISQGKWVSAFVSIIAVFPLVGDFVGLVLKVSKFVNRTESARGIQVAIGFISTAIDVQPARGHFFDLLNALLSDIDPNLSAQLDVAGVESMDSKLRLVASIGLDRLWTLLDESVPAQKEHFSAEFPETPWPQVEDLDSLDQLTDMAERYVKTVRGTPLNALQVRTNVIGSGFDRFYDVVDGADRIEVKMGKTTWSTAVKLQIDQDARAMAHGYHVVWVFVGNGISGIGPDTNALNYLAAKGIPFEIHFPA